jgi:hypothetical protein
MRLVIERTNQGTKQRTFGRFFGSCSVHYPTFSRGNYLINYVLRRLIQNLHEVNLVEFFVDQL